MHLVLHHVSEFEEVGDADSGRLVKALARLAVIDVGGAEGRKPCLVSPLLQIVKFGTIEDGRGKLHTQALAGGTKNGLENLTEVHARGHAHRVQNQVYGTAVGQERHVFHAHDLGDDALVAMAAGQFVTHLNLTLLGHVDLGHLHDARGQVVADGDGKLATRLLSVHLLVLLDEVHNEPLDEVVGMLLACPVVALYAVVFQIAQGGLGELAALGDDFGVGIVPHTLAGLAFRKFHELLDKDVLQVVDLCLILL